MQVTSWRGRRGIRKPPHSLLLGQGREHCTFHSFTFPEDNYWFFSSGNHHSHRSVLKHPTPTWVAARFLTSWLLRQQAHCHKLITQSSLLSTLTQAWKTHSLRASLGPGLPGAWIQHALPALGMLQWRVLVLDDSLHCVPRWGTAGQKQADWGEPGRHLGSASGASGQDVSAVYP